MLMTAARISREKKTPKKHEQQLEFVDHVVGLDK